MNFASRIRQTPIWVGRHSAKALLVATTLWAAGLIVHWNVTAHSRFVSAFEHAVWNWKQAGESAQSLDSRDLKELFAQLEASAQPVRWDAAAKLGSWREPSALAPLIAAMQDDSGTGRTCVVSQALGKLGEPAAVPALIRAAQHPDNSDLRFCATFSLGQIGDESALEFLVQRATNPSVPEDERAAVISALGEIGSPTVLAALESLQDGKSRLDSFVNSATKQIGLLQGNADVKLLETIGDNTDWIHDHWVLAQLHRRWSDFIAGELNAKLRTQSDLTGGLRLQMAALLTATRCLEPATLDFLTFSENQENRWLASLVLASLVDTRAANPQLLAFHP